MGSKTEHRRFFTRLSSVRLAFRTLGKGLWSDGDYVASQWQPERRMIFQTLYESAQRGELILIDGGFCHWHLRRDKQITIREIISTRPGAGSEMLERLKLQPAQSIFAKCPIDLPANEWYKRRGFKLETTSTTRTGKELNHWRLNL